MMSTDAASDDDDLEALFDRVAAEREQARAATPAAASDETAAAAHSTDDADAATVHQRIGQLTRTLHDALRELGYDRTIAAAAKSLPDTRDRLAYIATLTGQAAERVLCAVEVAQGVQQAIDGDAASIRARWHRLYARELSVEEFKTLALDTRAFFDAFDERTRATQAKLTDIMLAQDFHDLTGQVIKRIGDVVHTLESSLVALLIETRPREDADAEGFLTDPVVNQAARSDVVTSQAQVDELLEALGF